MYRKDIKEKRKKERTLAFKHEGFFFIIIKIHDQCLKVLAFSNIFVD